MSRKQLSVRVSEEIGEELERIAEAEHRSLNKQIEKALEEWLIETYDWQPPLEEAVEGVKSGQVEPAYKGE
ncbi:toxin-antitoxin system HicB family antitoxin [Candidatus Bipolaricaulota bacterium]|nr:toxin-antitoxin system HicB family antitoxin [Candidatus Bipolaricaulota bacterium]